MAVLLSIIPIILLFVLMLGFKMAGHKSAFITFVVTAIIALFAQQGRRSRTERKQLERFGQPSIYVR